MGKNVISEDIQKMVNLIQYDRGRTLTENKQQLNEIAVAPLVIAGAIGYGIWNWAADTWGSKSISAALKGALDRGTWPKIEKSLKETSIKAGKDISSKVDVISASQAKQYAEALYESMDGIGTYKDDLRDVMDDMGSFMDLARTSYEFGKKEGYSLAYWLDDELTSSEYATYVSNPMKSKPAIIFDGKNYNTIEEVIPEIDKLATPDVTTDDEALRKEIGAYLDGGICQYPIKDDEVMSDGNEMCKPNQGKHRIWIQKTFGLTTQDFKDKIKELGSDPKTELWKGKECVLSTAEENTAKWNDENTEVLITIGDAMAKFNNGGKFAYKGPDYQDGKKVLTGNYSCKGDDLAFAEDELSLSEGKVLTSALLSRIKNYLSEQITFGSIVLPVSGDEEPETPSDEVASTQQTKCTFDQILAGKCKAQKGQKGEVIGEIQEKLFESGVEGTGLPKHGADKDFGSETELAVKTFQTAKKLTPTGVVDKETAQILIKGAVASTEEVTPQEEKEIEVEVSQISSAQEAEEAMEVTKEEIKTLKQQKKDIRKQKRGLKKIQKMCKKFPNLPACKDTQSLQEWYLSDSKILS